MIVRHFFANNSCSKFQENMAQGLVGYDRPQTERQNGVVSPQDTVALLPKKRIINKNWPTIMHVHNNSLTRMKNNLLITLHKQF
jgi:hypothetical protein